VVIAEVDEQVMFCRFDAFEILVVEVALDEGLIMVDVAKAALVYRNHLN
jgi:hypothetical protein